MVSQKSDTDFCIQNVSWKLINKFSQENSLNDKKCNRCIKDCFKNPNCTSFQSHLCEKEKQCGFEKPKLYIWKKSVFCGMCICCLKRVLLWRRDFHAIKPRLNIPLFNRHLVFHLDCKKRQLRWLFLSSWKNIEKLIDKSQWVWYDYLCNQELHLIKKWTECCS